ncbi:MAG: hypothetical protein BV458_03535 [Thermoplasmata archaeon M9B2D]|nr:MAG: hypothetical protein BV458_03535 [Thermoplasmata archaeon M9B2D]
MASVSTMSANPDNTIQTFQTRYDDAVYPALQESAIKTLPDMISRIEQTFEGEKVVFYDIDPSNTSSTMDGTDHTDEGTAGDINSFEAEIEPIYAYRRVYKNEMNKTNLDLAGDFVQSFVRAVDRGVNLGFLGAIDDAKAGDEIGDDTLPIDELIDEVIESCELASLRVAERPEYAPTALLVMNSRDYARLHRSVKKISSDFSANVSGGMFYGAKVVTFEADVVPSGRTYVIPWGTTGHGRWETVEASATYQQLFDGMWCFAKKSGGTVVIQPESIDVIESLPFGTPPSV